MHESPSVWKLNERQDVTREQKLEFIKINSVLQQKVEAGYLNPLLKHLKSAYDTYRMPEGSEAE